MKAPWLLLIVVGLWVAHYTAYPGIPFWLCMATTIIYGAGILVILGIMAVVSVVAGSR